MPLVLDTEGREVQIFEAFSFNGNYEVKATGFRGTAIAGTTTAINFPIGVEDRHMNGIRLILLNHVEADTIGLQVVDIDNVLGYGAGIVLKTFGINWNIDSGVSDQGRDTYNFVAKLPAGVYVRLNYTSNGSVDVTVKLNCSFFKKLS
jgi:hypothetical protein